MAADAILELRFAAAAFATDTDRVHGLIADWLDGVADRMALGGWVQGPERDHALRIARAIAHHTQP